MMTVTIIDANDDDDGDDDNGAELIASQMARVSHTHPPLPRALTVTHAAGYAAPPPAAAAAIFSHISGGRVMMPNIDFAARHRVSRGIVGDSMEVSSLDIFEWEIVPSLVSLHRKGRRAL